MHFLFPLIFLFSGLDAVAVDGERNVLPKLRHSLRLDSHRTVNNVTAIVFKIGDMHILSEL